mgnify:FL=1
MHQYSAYPTIKDINIITNLFIWDSLLSVIFIFIFKITNCDLKRIVVILRTKVVLLAYKPLLHKPFL